MPFTMVNIVRTWPATGVARPMVGEIVLTPEAQFRNGNDFSAASYSARISGRRLQPLQVPATDDSGTTPAGVLYRVNERIVGVPSRAYYISVTAGAGTIDLATVTRLQGPSAAGRGLDPVTRDDLTAAVASGSGGGSSYTDEQARDAVGAALTAGPGIAVTVDDAGNTITVGVTDPLPEFASTAQTAAVGTPANMVGKITRYDTTAGAISQTFPAATAGRVVAVGWDAGTNALTLVAAGSDVIGSGSTTSVVVPLVGEALTYHCTTTGRWRVVSGFKTQASLDARFALAPARIYLPVARLDSTNGSAALASTGMLRGITLADAQNYHVGTPVDFPSSWHTYSIEAHWAARVTGTGNVCLRVDTATLINGFNLNGSLTSGTQGAYAANGQWVEVHSTVAANVAVDPAGPNLVRLIRLGNDATDTFAGDISLVALLLTRIT